MLADLGDPVTALNLDMDSDSFWSIWVNSPTVHALETGRMTVADFYCRMPAELAVDAQGFADRFNGWQLRLYDGVEEVLRSLTDRYRLALLSNTNPVHWAQVTAGNRCFAEFDHLFLSFETGRFKPDPAAFEQVTAHYGCDPGAIRFFDDSETNIAAAAQAGLDARLSKGFPSSVLSRDSIE